VRGNRRASERFALGRPWAEIALAAKSASETMSCRIATEDERNCVCDVAVGEQ